MSQEETTLLLQINQARLDPAQQARFDELVGKRERETIALEELRELIAITDTMEQRDVERLEALGNLARIRGVTLPVLMETLGIRTPAYG